MSEQINTNTQPSIEDKLKNALSGETLENALNYVAYMKAEGCRPPTPDSGVFLFDSDYVCQIAIYPVDNVPGWTIFLGGYDDVLHRNEYQNYPIDDALKEFAWEHVSPCGACGCGTQPGRRVMLFGREFTKVCTATLAVRNPDGGVLEMTKRLTDVLKTSHAEAAKKDKPYVPAANEWPSVRGFGAHTGRPLGKVYTKSLDMSFYITPKRRFVNDAVIGFSGGGWVPAALDQIPAALHIGHDSRFGANDKPSGDWWTSVETLKFQANVTYYAEMSVNITDNTYSATVWMLDADGERDTPYCIAKNYPFRLGCGDPAVPAITAIDTVYLGQDDDHILAFIVKDFKIVGGE